MLMWRQGGQAIAARFHNVQLRPSHQPPRGYLAAPHHFDVVAGRRAELLGDLTSDRSERSWLGPEDAQVVYKLLVHSFMPCAVFEQHRLRLQLPIVKSHMVVIRPIEKYALHEALPYS